MIFPICNKCPDRAPCIGGHTFLFCWRCTGLIIGAFLGMFIKCFTGSLGNNCYFLLIPIAIDGGLQYGLGVMSNNYRRFITGLIGGMITLN